MAQFHRNLVQIMRYKKIGLISLFTIVLFPASVRAKGIFDVSRLTQNNEFSASFGAEFKTGANKSGTGHDDIASGTIDDIGMGLSYTFLDDWTVSFSTSNDYADSQVGISYKILTNDGFKLDFETNYGIAWTKNAKTDERIGNNNIESAFRIHGIAGDAFQWAAKVRGTFVFAEPKNFWNFGVTLEGMYYFSDDWAAKTELNFTFKEIDNPVTLYDRSIKLGAVYNITSEAAVHPYVEYHFKTKNSEHSEIKPDDDWKIGAEFSVIF